MITKNLPISLNGNQLSRRGAAKTAVASPKKSKPAATKRTASPAKEPEPSSSPAKKAKKADKATDPPASPAAPTRNEMHCYREKGIYVSQK